MFGIDFSELVVILLVALVVIGPERLPKVARTAGHLWGRAQRYINGVKTDISREMAVEDMQKLRSHVEREANGVEEAMRDAAWTIDRQAQALNNIAAHAEQVATPQIPRRQQAAAQPQRLPVD